MVLMPFSSFSRNAARTAHRRRREANPASGQSTEPRRQAAMGISVQPVHGHHCICERCQRQPRRL
ncbi:MAG TPA: hypothetical protein VGF70_12455 [Solirubrobacteraceae bacterium]